MKKIAHASKKTKSRATKAPRRKPITRSDVQGKKALGVPATPRTMGDVMAEHGIAPATFTEKDRAELAAKVAKRAGAEPAEPTFTLAEIVGVFGSNYDVGYYTPIGRLALEALDDAMRTISCAYEALDVLGDDADAGNALYNCKCRLEVAQNLLNKLPGVKLDRPAAEVQS